MIYVIGKRPNLESDLISKKPRPHYTSSENDPNLFDTSNGHHKEPGKRKTFKLNT